LPEDERLAIVADGMGGHASGEVASRMAVETIAGYFRETAEEQEITWPYKIDGGDRFQRNRLVTAIKLANVRIFETAQNDSQKRGMGTTVVAFLVMPDRVVLSHVGDSRIYRMRDGEIEQLTEDHSLVNDYLRMGRLKKEEVNSFPHKNVIVRALGMKDTVQVDVHVEKPRVGDCYLLCSDGLSGMITDDDIAHIVRGVSDLDKAAEMLIEAANAAGGQDNITALLVRVEPP
jgi:protein phosphatase